MSHHKGAYEENFKEKIFFFVVHAQDHENVPKRYKYKNRSRQGIDFVVHVAYELLDFIKNHASTSCRQAIQKNTIKNQ